MRSVKIVIKGNVQGVFFRASVRRFALANDIAGRVKNLDDGSVEVVAQGSEESVAELIAVCHEGPSGAEVTEVLVENINIDSSLSGFSMY